MEKVFGTVLSLILVLTITGAPKPLIDTEKNIKHQAQIDSKLSTNYSTEPPDPMEWFLPKYKYPIKPAPVPNIIVNNNTVSTTLVPSSSQELAANVENWIEVRERLKHEREEKLARLKEGLEKMRKDIEDAVEKAKRFD